MNNQNWMWRMNEWAPEKGGIESGAHIGVSEPGSKRDVAQCAKKELGSGRWAKYWPTGK